MKHLRFNLLAACLLTLAGCSSASDLSEPVAAAAQNPDPVSQAPAENEAVISDSLKLISEKWTGDLDGIKERQYIRALVVYNKMSYFLDGAQPRGISYDAFTEFEKFLNKRLKLGRTKFHVVFLPVRRDQLIPALVEGRGDIAAANLTITPEREKLVDFSMSLLKNVSEVVVTGPMANGAATWDDLAGHEIHIRRSSSFYENLQRFNNERTAAGKQPLKIKLADEYLETDDLIEMANAGLIPATIADTHKAEFWDQIFDDITVHSELAINTGGDIAWAFRKDSPKLKAAVNDFAKAHKAGTLFGNILLKRYLKNTDWVRNTGTEAEMKKFHATVEYFKKYSGQYDFNWLLIMAQAYQESRLDQNVRSRVGAIGVMQLMPKTAAGAPISIPDIDKIDNNVHAGTKYLRHLIDHYFNDEELDELNRGLFAIAAYNAGPNRVRRLRREAADQGLDPNKWFRNVELIAAKRVGQEPVQYVSNIYKYYVAYQLLTERQRERQ